MTISRATLRANLFNDVYTVINSNVSDPESRSAKWIWTSMPDYTAPDFTGFPLIVIPFAEPSKERDRIEDAKHTINSEIMIKVFSKKNNQMDSLVDSIDAVMVPSNFPQFSFLDGYTERYVPLRVNKQTIHSKTMIYPIRVRSID